jgi:hypothetical protein
VLNLAEDPNHVDTNCLFLFEGAFHTLHHWVLQPREFSLIGDRVIWIMLKGQGLIWRQTVAPTVNYLCLLRPFYEALGLVPPDEAKPAVDSTPGHQYIGGLNERGLELLRRRTGIIFRRTA